MKRIQLIGIGLLAVSQFVFAKAKPVNTDPNSQSLLKNVSIAEVDSSDSEGSESVVIWADKDGNLRPGTP